MVRSINVSNHKFGFVYPGLAWLVCRDEDVLNDRVIYKSNYLSGISFSFGLNFSKSASPILVQYYNFIRFGINGYRNIIEKTLSISKELARLLESSGIFKVLSNQVLPIVVFKFLEQPKFKISEFVYLLGKKGWQLPCYLLPSSPEQVVMRIVVRKNSSINTFKEFYKDLMSLLNSMNKVSGTYIK